MIAHVASVSSAGPGSDTITSGAINTTGADLVVVEISWYTGTTASPTLSDSKGNTWTGLTQQTNNSRASRLFYCAGATVGTGHTFTLAGSTLFAVISAVAVSGAHAAPFASENGATTAFATSFQPGSVTPPEDGCLVVTGLALESASTPTTIDGGFTAAFTEHAADNIGGGLAWLVQGTAAAVNPTWSWSASGSPAAATIAAFKPAASGPPPPTLTTFDAYDIAPYFHGRYSVSSLSVVGVGLVRKSAKLHVRMKGTDATILIGGVLAGTNAQFECQVDGGSTAALTLTNASDAYAEVSVFDGLSDDWHLVTVRAMSDFYGVMRIKSATITGAAPEIAEDPDYGPNVLAIAPAPAVGTWADHGSGWTDPSSTAGAGNDTIRFRGTYETVYAMIKGGSTWTPVIDGVMQAAVVGTPPSGHWDYVPLVTGGDGTTPHTVDILGPAFSDMDGVMLGGGEFLATPTTLVHFATGDSITFGSGLAHQGLTWPAVACRLASPAATWISCNRAAAGQGILYTLAETELQLRRIPVAVDAVSILTGQNDITGVDGVAYQAQYERLLRIFLDHAKTARARIHAMTVMAPPGGTVSADLDELNDAIRAAVTAVGDARVTLVDSELWAVNRPDNVHPDAAGAAQFAALYEPYLTAAAPAADAPIYAIRAGSSVLLVRNS